ncbi:MAG: hypothetical protein O2897_01990 [bacterium]|nr:hypothetical protein [bacterium]
MAKDTKSPRGNAEKPLLIVGGSRNAHGTRISKRVKCFKCGAVDYILARPKDGKPCCKACAKELMNVVEEGSRIPKELVKKNCFNCQSEFELPKTARIKEGGPLCPNCKKGFEIWRGSLGMSPEGRDDMQLEKRTSGTLLRKKTSGKTLDN